MRSQREAENAIRLLDGTYMQGRRLRVKRADPKRLDFIYRGEGLETDDDPPERNFGSHKGKAFEKSSTYREQYRAPRSPPHYSSREPQYASREQDFRIRESRLRPSNGRDSTETERSAKRQRTGSKEHSGAVKGMNSTEPRQAVAHEPQENEPSSVHAPTGKPSLKDSPRKNNTSLSGNKNTSPEFTDRVNLPRNPSTSSATSVKSHRNNDEQLYSGRPPPLADKTEANNSEVSQSAPAKEVTKSLLRDTSEESSLNASTSPSFPVPETGQAPTNQKSTRGEKKENETPNVPSDKSANSSSTPSRDSSAGLTKNFSYLSSKEPSQSFSKSNQISSNQGSTKEVSPKVSALNTSQSAHHPTHLPPPSSGKGQTRPVSQSASKKVDGPAPQPSNRDLEGPARQSSVKDSTPSVPKASNNTSTQSKTLDHEHLSSNSREEVRQISAKSHTDSVSTSSNSTPRSVPNSRPISSDNIYPSSPNPFVLSIRGHAAAADSANNVRENPSNLPKECKDGRPVLLYCRAA